ncbi:winged helix-turn-helix domain-containing protein [bacterium]|nr:winged helix-turn-helix domain-containing protein [bacterium]
MSEKYTGVSVRSTPFITMILAPQLKLRQLPLHFVERVRDIPHAQSNFVLLDGAAVIKQDVGFKQQLTTFLETQNTSIALMLERNHKTKLELLEIGFHLCLEIPIATEVIIKTLENNMKKSKTAPKMLRESMVEYQTGDAFSYVYDNIGRSFLLNKTKSTYLSTNEQGILEYLVRRKGFASNKELAYAGWKNFDVRPNTITVAVKKLRYKISKLSLPYKIRTLYGYGYILEQLQD